MYMENIDFYSFHVSIQNQCICLFVWETIDCKVKIEGNIYRLCILDEFGKNINILYILILAQQTNESKQSETKQNKAR